MASHLRPAYNDGPHHSLGGCTTRKTFGGAILALVVLAGGIGIAADKDTKKGTTKAGVVEIKKGKDDKFRFFVRNADGKLLAMSGPGGFADPKSAELAVDHLREVIATAKVKVVEKKEKDK